MGAGGRGWARVGAGGAGGAGGVKGLSVTQRAGSADEAALDGGGAPGSGDGFSSPPQHQQRTLVGPRSLPALPAIGASPGGGASPPHPRAAPIGGLDGLGWGVPAAPPPPASYGVAGGGGGGGGGIGAMPGRPLGMGRSSSSVMLRAGPAAAGQWASSRNGGGGGQPPGAAYLASQFPVTTSALPSTKERALGGSSDARHRELMHERERYFAWP